MPDQIVVDPSQVQPATAPIQVDPSEVQPAQQTQVTSKFTPLTTGQDISSFFSTLAKDAYNAPKAFMDALTDPNENPIQKLTAMGTALTEGRKQAWRDAKDAYTAGNYKEAFDHLMGSIPLIGPIFEPTMNEMRQPAPGEQPDRTHQGQTGIGSAHFVENYLPFAISAAKEIIGGPGGGGPGGPSGGGPGGGGGGLFKVRNQLTPQDIASNVYFDENGIPIPLSLRTGSPAAAAIEQQVGRSIGGGRFGAQMQASKEALVSLGKETAAQIAPDVGDSEAAGGAVSKQLAQDLQETKSDLANQVSQNPTSPEAAGQGVIDAGKAKIKQYDQAADQAYKAAYQAEQDPRNFEDVPILDKNGHPLLDEDGNVQTEQMALPVDMTGLQKALKPILERYEYTLTPTQARDSPGVSIMQRIISGPPKKPLSAAELDRGLLIDAAKNENIPELRERSQGLAAIALKGLTDAIDQKMASASYPGWDPASGTPSPALTNLRAGRLATAQKYDIADTLATLGKRNPDDLEPVGVFNGLTWANDSGINRLRDIARIVPEAIPQVGRAFIDDGGNWDKLGDSTKQVLFRDPNIISGLDDYYDKLGKFLPLTKMEPVALFDRLTALGGRRNQLLSDIAANAPEQMPGVARAWVEGLIDRATREGDIRKVQSTLDQWLDMSPKTKAMLIEDPALVNDFNNFFFSLKRMAGNVNPSGSGFMNALNQMKGTIFRGLGLIGGGLAGHGTTTAGLGYLAGQGLEIGANAGLARLLFNKRFIRMVTRGMDMDMAGDAAGARLTARTLAGMVPPEEPPTPPETPPPPPETPPPEGGGTPPPAPSGGGGGGGNPRPAPAGSAGGAAPGEETAPPIAKEPSLQERLQTLGDEAFDRVKNSGTFQGRTLPSLFPAEVTKDMVTWGAARIANGAIDLASWSKAMLADAADISPEAAAKVKGMLPQLWVDSKKQYEHHLNTFGAENLADLPKIMQYYEAGKEGKNWYNFVRPALHPLFGENTDLFLKMMAATSPNTTVTQNVTNAVRAYRQFLLGEPFTGMPAHVDNLNRAVAGIQMSGPKVSAFGPNLMGNLTPVTVDLWMARALLGRDTVTPLQSKLVDYMTSQAAKEVNLQPAEMQAAIWTGIKKIMNSKDTAAPPEQIVNEYLNKNPDVRKLFEDSLQMSKEHFQGLQSKQAPAKPPRN